MTWHCYIGCGNYFKMQKWAKHFNGKAVESNVFILNSYTKDEVYNYALSIGIKIPLIQHRAYTDDTELYHIPKCPFWCPTPIFEWHRLELSRYGYFELYYICTNELVIPRAAGLDDSLNYWHQILVKSNVMTLYKDDLTYLDIEKFLKKSNIKWATPQFNDPKHFLQRNEISNMFSWLESTEEGHGFLLSLQF